MKHLILALSLVSTFAMGCESDGNAYHPKGKATNLAAYAGAVSYPTNMQPIAEQSITATVHPRTGVITIRNFTNKTLLEPRVWVNQIFVLKVPSLGPQSSIELAKEDFYDSAGRSLASQPPSAIKKIQLQTEQSLIDVQGPLFE
jgi:hypothetical protein